MKSYRYVLLSDAPIDEELRECLLGRFSWIDELVLGTEVAMSESTTQLLSLYIRPRIIYVLNGLENEPPTQAYTRYLQRIKYLTVDDVITCEYRSAQDTCAQETLYRCVKWSARFGYPEVDNGIVSVSLVARRGFVSFENAHKLTDMWSSGPGVIVGDIISQCKFLSFSEPATFASLKAHWWLIGTSYEEHVELDDMKVDLSIVDSFLCEQRNLFNLSIEEYDGGKVYPFSELRSSLCDKSIIPLQQRSLYTKDFFTFITSRNLTSVMEIFHRLKNFSIPLSGLVAVAPDVQKSISSLLASEFAGSNLLLRTIAVSSIEELTKAIDDCGWGILIGDDKIIRARAADMLSRHKPFLCSRSLLHLSYINDQVVLPVGEDEEETIRNVFEIKNSLSKFQQAMEQHCLKHNIGYYNFNCALGQSLISFFKEKGWKFNLDALTEVNNAFSFKDIVKVPIYVIGMLRFR